jgi:hypothetical protein
MCARLTPIVHTRRLISMLGPRLVLATGLLVVPGWAQGAGYCAEGDGRSALAVHAEQVQGPLPVTNLGPVADTLGQELVTQICGSAAVLRSLPNTCAPLSSVSEVRARLLMDLAALPATALADRLSTLAPEQRLGIAFLAATSAGVEPAEVSHRVASVLRYAGSECVAPSPNGNDPVNVAVSVVWALTHDLPDNATEADAAARLGAVWLALRGAAPGPEEQPFITRLAGRHTQLLAARAGWRADPRSSAALERLLLVEFTTFQDALSLALARETTLPPEAWATLSAIVHANPDAAVEQLQPWLAARSQLDPGVLDAARLVLRFARATSGEQAERIVRGEVLGLGPWSEKVLFSASAGVPQLESNDFNLVGEGMLGYNDDAWGLSGNGGASVLEFESDEYLASTVKLYGGGDGWFSLEIADRTRFDLRADAEVVIFDSDTSVIASDVILNGEETSLLARGSGLVGIRHQAPGFAVGAWAGAGGQLESYDRRATVVTADDAPTQLDDVATTSLVLSGRARLQLALLPELLALRVAADGKYYELSRMSAVIDTTAALDEMLIETDEGALQLELLGRLYVDVEAARVFGFVPAAGVGIDHYQLAVTGQDTQVANVPIYLLGIRRTTF